MLSRHVFTQSYRELVSFFADAGELDTTIQLTDDQLATCLEQHTDVVGEVWCAVPADQVVRILAPRPLGPQLADQLRRELMSLAVSRLALSVEQELSERDLEDDHRPAAIAHYSGLAQAGAIR